MMKKFFLFSFILLSFLLPSVVSAEETKTGIGYLNNSTVIISNDRGVDIQLARQTTNQNQLDIRTIIFQSSYNFLKNVVYEYEVELNNSYVTNNINKFSLTGYNMTCSLISIQGLNSNYMKIRFTCPNDTSYIQISISNLSGNSITTGYLFGWNTIYLWSITDQINLGPIINNDNTNTQNIINNNSQNTQDIINNDNTNTQNIINANKVCREINKNSIKDNNKSLQNSDGTMTNATNFGVTDFISTNDISLTLLNKNNSYQANICFYTSNKTFISCMKQQDLSQNQTITIPTNSSYFRATIEIDANLPTWNLCTNGNQVISDSINNLDNTISDSSIGSSANDGASFLNNFTTDTFGLTAIITAPLSLIQSITSSTCSTLDLPLPYLDNKYLTLPCMSSIYQQYFGTLFTLYQTITFGVIAYWVCIRIFNLVKDFKNPEHDEIEVMDL